MQTKWINWGKNLEAYPISIFSPKNKFELLKLIKEAREKKINIHAYGAKHSWSNLVPTSGYLINTDNLNKLLSVDLSKKQISIEAGMTLHELNKILDEQGLALSNMGRVTVQSVAGATATGTHGTGHTATMSSFIIGAELITDNATSQVISLDDPDTLAAIKLSLGGLGIIYSLTLQCESKFTLSSYCYITDFENLFKNYAKHLESNDHWMFEWNPYTGKALAYEWNKTNQLPSPNYFGNVISAIKELTLNFLTLLSKPFPNLTPFLIDLRFRSSAHGTKNAKSFLVFTRPYQGMRYVECELSIKYDYLEDAVKLLKEMFSDYSTKNIFVPRVTFRFVAEEKATLLSPVHDGNRVFISLVMPAHSEFKMVFSDYQSRMEKFEARPHWGKVHRMDKDLAEKLYGENLDKYRKIREKLDPEKLFLNDQVKSFL